MAALPPGDISTQPNTKVVYNAPFSEKNVYHVRVQNDGARRIGWAAEVEGDGRRLQIQAVRPSGARFRHRAGVSYGVLDDGESAVFDIICDPFDFAAADTSNDRISLEWVNAPEGAAKKFHREWFQDDGMVRRKNLPIEYNS